LPTPRGSAYIEGAAGAAAFFAVRRLAGFFAALRAGFLVAFFATLRFTVFFAVLRVVFFAVLRAGFLAAALRTVVRFFATFLRAGFLFAVIGIERLPLEFGQCNTHLPKTGKICGCIINEAILSLTARFACQAENRETQ
jgi:hypothetical protein